MKIVLPKSKPRAKWLNDILLSKRGEAHATVKKPNRSKSKKIVRDEMKHCM